ncbi:hypothetical protein PGSY75_1314700 [Plasmodium gaboni]|uniref:Pinin/SDK/MemA protein domain-containing protein n=1 Tax=Plasmodium gaboni TaxID=647221 RepID=A0A151LDC0_9APIC|nr:hypothetical protein PGSY75_1314700 [Plasmodium gaboni]KYN96948.1 hypothetical protein PGSY75_1314700 [Plasmodium gaboni]
MKEYLSEQERLKLKIRNNYFEKNAIRSKIVNYLNRLTDLSIDHKEEDIKKLKQKRISSNENLDKLPEFKIEKRPKLEEDETTVNRNKRLLQIGLFDHLRKAKDALEQEKTDEKVIMHNLQNKRVEEKIHEVKRSFEKIELDDIEIKIIAYVKDMKMIEECIKQDEDKLMKLNLISHYEKMKNFISTNTYPTIFWCPLKFNDKTRILQKNTEEFINKKIDAIKSTNYQVEFKDENWLEEFDKLKRIIKNKNKEYFKNKSDHDQNNIYENEPVGKSGSHHDHDLEEEKCISLHSQKSDKRSMSVYSSKSDELNKDDKKNNSLNSENEKVLEDKTYSCDEKNQNESDYKNDDNKLMVCKNEENVLENHTNENNSMDDTLKEKLDIKKGSRARKERNSISPERIKTENSDDSIKYVGDENEKVVLKNNTVQEEEEKFMDKVFEGEENTGESYEGNENTGKSYGGEENTGKSYEGNENTGKSYEGEENTGKSHEGEENTGKSYEGEENTGKSYEGEENTGKSYECEENTGKSHEGEENTGKSYEGEENTGKSYEVNEEQKGKAKRGRPKGKSKRKGKIK